MITKFAAYINESRKSIDELEVLTSDQLGELLLDEIHERPPDIQFIQDVITVGCPIDVRDDRGRTALNYAAFIGNLEIVKLLISNGADVNAKCNSGRTALHRAAWFGYVEIVKHLISNGAMVDIRSNDNKTAWDEVNMKCKEEVPELNPNK